jgi:putative membrane protein
VLWLKAFHIVFVVAWFAGLFYLPRLFVYHVEASDQGAAATALDRFATMEQRLLRITHLGALLALGFGIALVVLAPAWLQQGWLHAKLALVLLLLGYHGWCVRLAAALRSGRNRHGSRWFRIFNEVPALLLVAIVCLVVVKPF